MLWTGAVELEFVGGVADVVVRSGDESSVRCGEATDWTCLVGRTSEVDAVDDDDAAEVEIEVVLDGEEACAALMISAAFIRCQ